MPLIVAEFGSHCVKDVCIDATLSPNVSAAATLTSTPVVRLDNRRRDARRRPQISLEQLSRVDADFQEASAAPRGIEQEVVTGSPEDREAETGLNAH